MSCVVIVDELARVIGEVSGVVWGRRCVVVRGGGDEGDETVLMVRDQYGWGGIVCDLAVVVDDESS